MGSLAEALEIRGPEIHLLKLHNILVLSYFLRAHDQKSLRGRLVSSGVVRCIDV